MVYINKEMTKIRRRLAKILLGVVFMLLPAEDKKAISCFEQGIDRINTTKVKIEFMNRDSFYKTKRYES